MADVVGYCQNVRAVPLTQDLKNLVSEIADGGSAPDDGLLEVYRAAVAKRGSIPHDQVMLFQIAVAAQWRNQPGNQALYNRLTNYGLLPRELGCKRPNVSLCTSAAAGQLPSSDLLGNIDKLSKLAVDSAFYVVDRGFEACPNFEKHLNRVEINLQSCDRP